MLKKALAIASAFFWQGRTIMMHQKKLCVSKATLTSSLFTITYYLPKIDKPF